MNKLKFREIVQFVRVTQLGSGRARIQSCLPTQSGWRRAAPVAEGASWRTEPEEKLVGLEVRGPLVTFEDTRFPEASWATVAVSVW